MPRVRLPICITDRGSSILSRLFDPECTGDDACQTALHYFGRDPDPAYRVLLRDDSGQERWLSPSARLCDQGVGDGMLLHILVPPPSQTTIGSQEPTFRFPGQAPLAPFPNVYAAEVVNPRFDAPLDQFYVNLADYEQLKKIGGVYSVRQRAIGEIFAMKELSRDVNDAMQQENYRRELVLLATLLPRIPGLDGCTLFGTENGPAILTFLMSPFAQTYVNTARADPPFWTPTQKLLVMLGVVSGLASLHRNVRIDEQDTFRIADFGVSTISENPGPSASTAWTSTRSRRFRRGSARRRWWPRYRRLLRVGRRYRRRLRVGRRSRN